MIVIAGHIDFADRENRDAAVEASIPHQRASREDEPGCLAYCFAPDPVVDTRVQVYELWESAEALAPHFEHENYFNMRDTLGRFAYVGADNKKYRVDAVDDVYGTDEDGNRVASVRFWSVGE